MAAGARATDEAAICGGAGGAGGRSLAPGESGAGVTARAGATCARLTRDTEARGPTTPLTPLQFGTNAVDSAASVQVGRQSYDDVMRSLAAGCGDLRPEARSPTA